MTFEQWWKQTNENADTTDKDAKYSLVKDLSKAVWNAALDPLVSSDAQALIDRGKKEANKEMAQCLIDGLSNFGKERLFARQADAITYNAYLIARDILENNP